MRAWMGIIFAALTLLLSGCAPVLIADGLGCLIGYRPHDYTTHLYEVQIRMASAGGIVEKSAHVTCKPADYYCGGGTWWPKLGQRSGHFVFSTPKGRLTVAYPGCNDLWYSGTRWKDVDDLPWPDASLQVGGDEYTFGESEMRQKNAVEVVGLSIQSYRARRVAEKQDGRAN